MVVTGAAGRVNLDAHPGRLGIVAAHVSLLGEPDGDEGLAGARHCERPALTPFIFRQAAKSARSARWSAIEP